MSGLKEVSASKRKSDRLPLKKIQERLVMKDDKRRSPSETVLPLNINKQAYANYTEYRD